MPASGRRISPSTSTTLCSASANANAMFIAVVDLPSFGIELVTTITRGGLSTARNCKLVRSLRNASAIAELSLSKDIAGSFRRSLSSGMLPTSPTPVISSRISRSLTVLSSRSRRTARPIPNSTPSARPMAMLRVGLRNHRMVGNRRALLDDNTSIGLGPVLRSLQFAYHDDELVGQCVGNVTCPDG